MKNTDYISINKYCPTPLYEQLRISIRTAIHNGILIPGEKLPTEDEVCRRFSVSRPVIRQAYNELVNEGIVSRERGKGSFVTEKNNRGATLMKLLSFKEEMNLLDKPYFTKILNMQKILYNSYVYNKLKLERNAVVLKISRVRYVDGAPFAYIENYIPLERFEGIEQFDFSKISLYETMEQKYNAKPIKAEKTIKADIIKPELVNLLETSNYSAVHVLESVVYDQNEMVIDYSYEVFPGETHQFDICVFSKN